MGLEANYPKPNLSKKHPEHKIYPYLLKDVEIDRVDQVWSTDITYIRLQGGFVYLIAIIDWRSRYVLEWELSTTLEADFCIETLARALEQGRCEIFNTDQGSQFTASNFVKLLLDKGIEVSMDGKGRALDNVFVERLWRSLKYELIYQTEYKSVREAKKGIGEYFLFYNNERFHQALNYKTPKEVYFSN
jgi:putative transposase